MTVGLESHREHGGHLQMHVLADMRVGGHGHAKRLTGRYRGKGNGFLKGVGLARQEVEDCPVSKLHLMLLGMLLQAAHCALECLCAA